MTRLSVVDEMFLHRHRGSGLPSVMQGLWRTDDTVHAPLLISLHDALSQGPLGRRVVRPRIPGARPRFVPSTHSYPLRYPSEKVADDAIVYLREVPGERVLVVLARAPWQGVELPGWLAPRKQVELLYGGSLAATPTLSVRPDGLTVSGEGPAVGVWLLA